MSTSLDEVACGTEVMITRWGIPVARQVPANTLRRSALGEPVARAKAFARQQTLGRLSCKTLRDEGRR